MWILNLMRMSLHLELKSTEMAMIWIKLWCLSTRLLLDLVLISVIILWLSLWILLCLILCSGLLISIFQIFVHLRVIISQCFQLTLLHDGWGIEGCSSLILSSLTSGAVANCCPLFFRLGRLSSNFSSLRYIKLIDWCRSPLNRASVGIRAVRIVVSALYVSFRSGSLSHSPIRNIWRPLRPSFPNGLSVNSQIYTVLVHLILN